MDEEKGKAVIQFEAHGQTVELSPSTVVNYLVSGGGEVSGQEVHMFMAICKYQRLNPFLRDAYLIKYGNQPAAVVVSKELLLKRAARNPKYEGFKAGISGDGEDLTAWCEVFVNGYKHPVRSEVYYDEYVGLKKDGTPNRMWAGKKRTMLRKVAVAQAHREACPEDLGAMVTPEEVREISEILPTDEIKSQEPTKENEDLEIPETKDNQYPPGTSLDQAESKDQPTSRNAEAPEKEDPPKLSPKDAFEKVRIRIDTRQANNIILVHSKSVGRALRDWIDSDYLTIGKQLKDISK